MKILRDIKGYARKSMPSFLLEQIRQIRRIKWKFNAIEENQINQLKRKFPSVDKLRTKKASFRDHEFKVYSQNGEDGLLLHIFSKIGVKNHSFIEFGIEEGKECNTANLSINFGWNGLLLEGSITDVLKARAYYKSLDITSSQVKVGHCFVTKENINRVFSQHKFKGEIDLLSIDIDGNDYWIWKEISVVKPRVVVIEYNALLGSDEAITVQYDPAFDRFAKFPAGTYWGASLAALTKLAKSKGYVLVGCDSHATNAFFVRKDLAKKKLPELSVKEAYYPKRGYTPEEQNRAFERMKNLNFVKV